MPPKRAIPCYTCGPPNDGTTSPFYQCNLLQQQESMSDDESSTGSVEENVEVEETTDLSNS